MNPTIEAERPDTIPPYARDVIAVDFDGTIYPWGPLYERRAPFEGVVKALRWYKSLGYNIVIFTSRLSRTWARHELGLSCKTCPLGICPKEVSDTETRVDRFIREQRDYIRNLLSSDGIPFDAITAEKVPAELYIDDRALRFNGDWTTTQALSKYVLSMLSGR